ncbi:hypothetical protein E5676_scaffold607G00360 [Cucumis melo var. makuwa]|uniref:Uncharacterized protein n=1 Tax=Cucumis melo var. makuwa TaxID=1194695 RepID=A0A5D3D4J0_CUCMM|nr:hypothetical protein E6C27_scaffold121G001160 [Cucumis melo var. makuwa]TYK18467.1 hypothetical protein E5676_scaffold607G00360 [Cucumis melo var. makuwa]
MSSYSQLSLSVVACAIVGAPPSHIRDRPEPEPLTALFVCWKSSRPQSRPHKSYPSCPFPQSSHFLCQAELPVFLPSSHLASFSPSQAIFSHQAYFWLLPIFLNLSKCKLNSASFLGVPLGLLETRYVPTGSQIACVQERASLEAEVKVRAKGSWRMTRIDHGEP